MGIKESEAGTEAKSNAAIAELRIEFESSLNKMDQKFENKMEVSSAASAGGSGSNGHGTHRPWIGGGNLPPTQSVIGSCFRFAHPAEADWRLEVAKPAGQYLKDSDLRSKISIASDSII